ncbi:MAG: HNH endonuclease [Bdellovibrionales bacterium]|nr:HNH endonuclease [Bdellovibrionales bacterium]
MNEQMTMPTGDQTIVRIPFSNKELDAGAKVNPEGGSQADIGVPPKIRELHAKALAAVARWKTAEIELLQVLDEVENHKAYFRYGYNSLFQYAVKALGFSESVAYNFINVGRAAREIPELKAEIASGALSVSKARKITSVLTRENSTAWIELAKSSSQQKLEREVSLANPRELGRGRMSYVPPQNEIAEKVVVNAPSGARAAAEPRVQLEVGISEKLMIKIRCAQGLLGQKRRRGTSLEDTLEAMVELYLSKHDPTERAKRQLMRGKLNIPSEASDATKIKGIIESANDKEFGKPEGTSSRAQKMSNLQFLRIAGETTASNARGAPATERTRNEGLQPATRARTGSLQPVARTGSPRAKRFARRPLAAATKHRVYLKFQARCSHVDRRGERCNETKFLEIHHLRPLHEGGDDRLENLTLLCSGHHKGIHLG